MYGQWLSRLNNNL